MTITMYLAVLRRSALVAVCTLIIGGTPAFGDETALPPEVAAAGIEFFESKVRPIFAEHCHSCHGADMQKSGLRLDRASGIFAGGDTGPVLIQGEPEKSRIVSAIQYTNNRLMMPPDQKLPEDAIQAISDWIAMGAPWPEDDELITQPDEEHSKSEWIERLKRHHWSFQPVESTAIPEDALEGWSAHPVDRFIGARLAEAGMLPSVEADGRSLVRRIYYDLTGLAPSPERVANFMAEAGDEAWEALVDELLESPQFGERWARYWLDIARYADTKGYVFQEDRFFPYSYTYRDYVIRAFNRDLPYDEFIRHQIAADMMELGDDPEPLAGLGFLTLGRRFINNIHDITDDRIDVVTRGFLGLTVSCARCHDHMYDPVTAEDYYALYGVFRSVNEPGELPLLGEPDPEDPQYQAFLQAVEEREIELERVTDDIHTKLLQRVRDKYADYFRVAYEAQPLSSEDEIKLLAKERALEWQVLKRWRDYMAARIAEPDGLWRPLAWFAAIDNETFAEEGLAVTERIRANDNPEALVNDRLVKAFGGPVPETMDTVLRRYIGEIRKADKAWGDLLAVHAQRKVQSGLEEAEFPTALSDPGMEAFRLLLYGPESPANIPRSDTFQFSDVPTQGRIRNARNAIDNTKATHPGRPDRAMAVEDAPNPFDPYVFNRGKPDARGPEVPRRFLEALAGADAPAFEQGSGRLELANAIASADNPLTARVFVNRVWGFLFGKPLVDTPSDLGLRSNPPTHPELLDYLAASFVENDWSMKWLIRHIVTSKTYRQSSAYDPARHEQDSENRLLARQNRERLDLEAMRDSILQAAGTLEPIMFGKPVDITVAPYPARRTVYAFIERQNLPNLFRTFDFASPDAHSPGRFRTTVPQQALYMMNSPFVVEQARAFASWAEAEAGDGIADRIRAMYAKAYQREPDAAELGLALDFIESTAIAFPESYAWRYGYGGLDPELGVVSFTSYPHFDGNAWKGGPELPDPALGWSSITARGGHPGKPGFDSVLRFTAPTEAMVSVKGTLEHKSAEGDGVHGAIVLNGGETLWQGHVHNTASETRLDAVPLKRGDTLDFVVHCGEHESFDGYNWAPEIQVVSGEAMAAETGGRMAWRAEADFQGPPPAPLEAWEQYAQVLLLSNEFLFVD